MKSPQLAVLLVVVVAMIFAITFASMNLLSPAGKGGKGNNSGKPTLQLTFATTHYPPGGEKDVHNPLHLPTTEFGQTDRRDFWFENRNDQEVLLKLSKKYHDSQQKTGKSSEDPRFFQVQVFLAPDAWRSDLTRMATGLVGCGASKVLAGGIRVAWTAQEMEGLQQRATGLQT